MALWKDPAPANTAVPPPPPPKEPSGFKEGFKDGFKDSFKDVPKENERSAAAVPFTPARAKSEAKESLIAADVTIEGKIEGAGHVRIAGRFKGDVNVDGNLTIEAGAHLTGQVRAKTVVIGGELHGNIEGASRVELLESGVLSGDVKAGAFTVAAGSRMRGQVEFGWDEKGARVAAAS